jgi:predicted tellurium resistance membrane protein TerC
MIAIKKTTPAHSAGIALSAISLQWLDCQHIVGSFSTELYIIFIAVAFSVLGLRVGSRLVSR